MTLRLATLCTLLAASTSLAQVLPRLAILGPSDPTGDTYTFGADQCNDTLTLRWSNTLTNLTQCGIYPLKLWSTAGQCLDSPGASDTRYADIPGAALIRQQDTFTVKISELPDFKVTTTADGGMLNACGSPTPFTKEHRVCGSVDYAFPAGFGGTCGAIMKQAAVPLKLVYDTEPPAKPKVTEATAQDKAVRVAFKVDADTALVTIEVKGPADLDFREVDKTSSANQYIRAEGLDNNVTYEVRLRAKDAAGNVSDPSDPPEKLTPILTLGFWGQYKSAGGTDAGDGCSVGTGLLPLLAVMFARRRVRAQAKVRREP